MARLGVTDPGTQLSLLVGLAAVVWCLESLFEYLYHVKWRELVHLIQHDLRRDVYAHLQRIDLVFFQANATGDLACSVNDDINQLGCPSATRADVE